MQLLKIAILQLVACWPVVVHSHSEQSPLLQPSVLSTSPLLEFHKSLCEFSSISHHEGAVAQYLVSYLTAHNLTVETQRVDYSTDSRMNVLAYYGRHRRTRVLLSSHIDVVPPFIPYERHGDVIWGRGTVDAKGAVAAQVIATMELFASLEISEGDLGLLFVVGEEIGGDGMRKVNELNMTWETVIFGEPTELKLASGHKGTMSLDIKAKGKAGHSGYPELGQNANSMLIKVLSELEKMELPYSEKYGNTTLNIGTMEGGVAANVIAETASAKISFRIANGGIEQLEELVMQVVEGTGLGLGVDFHGGYEAVDTDHDVPGRWAPGE